MQLRSLLIVIHAAVPLNECKGNKLLKSDTSLSREQHSRHSFEADLNLEHLRRGIRLLIHAEETFIGESMKIVFPTDINDDAVVISVIFSGECCGLSFECQLRTIA